MWLISASLSSDQDTGGNKSATVECFSALAGTKMDVYLKKRPFSLLVQLNIGYSAIPVNLEADED
jgi:hypothetical protein